MGKYAKKMKDRWLVWIMAFAMVLTGIALPENLAKVEAGEVTLSADQLSAVNAAMEANTAGNDYIKDVRFGIPDVAQSKNAITSNGVKSLEVKVTVTDYSSGNAPSAMLYVQPGQDGGWQWNATDGKSITKNQQITLNYNFSDMDWNGGTTMGNMVLRFAGSSAGTISYQVDSAKLITETGTSGSGSSGSDNTTGGSAGGNATAEQLTGVSATVNTLSDKGNGEWSEYNLTIANNTDEEVANFIIRIPVSGQVQNFQFWNCNASYSDGYILIRHSVPVAANSTYTYGSDDKFGFSGGGVLGTPEILVDDGTYTSSSALNYELTGQKKDIAFEDTPYGKHGKLSLKEVDGYDAPVIVDENGTPFQLRGASTHGIHWNEMTPYVNKDAFQSLRDEWGVNMVRLVSYVTQGGYTEGSGALLDTKIQEGVEYATELGMYVIIDWHIHAENPHNTKSQAETFFQTYASKYKDYDNVIFEICNEPTGVEWYNGSGGDLYSYCKDICNIIRNAGSNALIVCGTNTWSQDVDDVVKKPLKDDGFQNILYTFHFYAATHYGDKMDKVRKAISDGTPIFVTEFGICSADGNGNFDTANADEWIALLDANNISYACWSLCNKAEAASYLSTGCSKTSGGWVESDLATTGIWLVNTYRAHQDREQGVDTSKGEDSGQEGSGNQGTGTGQEGSGNQGTGTGQEGSGNQGTGTGQEGSGNQGTGTGQEGSGNQGTGTGQEGSGNQGTGTGQEGSGNQGTGTGQEGSGNQGTGTGQEGSGNQGTGTGQNSNGSQNGDAVNPGGSGNGTVVIGNKVIITDKDQAVEHAWSGVMASVAEQSILSQKSDKDIAGSTYGKLSMRAAKATKKSIKLKWNRVSGATGYVVYGNRCGSKNQFKKLATVKSTNWTQKKLKKGTYYKYVVVAYQTVSGHDVALSISKTIHAATAGGKKGNAKKIKVNKANIKLKKGKKFRIKAKQIAASKKTKIAKHRAIAFESSNCNIADVTAKGVIKAKKKGSCTIYVYAQNGISKKVKVTVK